MSNKGKEKQVAEEPVENFEEALDSISEEVSAEVAEEEAENVDAEEEVVVEEEEEVAEEEVEVEEKPEAKKGESVMVLNVIHDGESYVSGQSYKLSADLKKLFKEKGFIL